MRRTAGNRTEDSPFKRYRGPEISYRTMGFIGFGAIGARVKHLLNGFDMNFLVYDPYLPAEIAEKEGVKLCSLDEVLAGSDFVSVHCAVTPQTTGMIGAEEFKKMKPTAYFINTARGKIADRRGVTKAAVSPSVKPMMATSSGMLMPRDLIASKAA